MVQLSKTPLPPGITITSADDYRKDVVFKTLAADCYNKCYICEDKPSTINVEHIIPHRKDPKLKYDWNNLFIACGHCNNTKLAKYDNILDPTKSDPEEHIALSIDISDDLINCVSVELLTTDSAAIQTSELLKFVYNGGLTELKEIECSNLRNEHLLPNIRLFYQYIKNYSEEPDLGYDIMIKKEISRSSAFAAFKRKIVRDDPKLSLIFADLLN
ncbi:MAG: HNH endonuclease [Clostridiales bacterium]|jgi:hypothetical protein|nr:HNH endonuclease [Clostridiales bacterium]